MKKAFVKINGEIYSDDVFIKNPLLYFLLVEGDTTTKRLVNRHGEVEACEVTEYYTTDVFTLAKKLTCIVGGALLSYGLLVLLIGLAPMPR